MKNSLEVVLVALALTGLYCAIPQSVAPINHSSLQSAEQVLIADGSDPMPLCRGKHCNDKN
jgi:hypothetical protein